MELNKEIAAFKKVQYHQEKALKSVYEDDEQKKQIEMLISELKFTKN